MTRREINDIIVSLFKEKDNFKNIGLDDDYFERGVSSITIVGMQIKIEEQLGVSISTRDLMALSTINQWVDTYAAAKSADLRKSA
jgi:acyl carrier protein